MTLELVPGVSKPTLRVFVAVLALASAGQSISLRKVARRLGFTSPNAVRPALLRLKRMGWIEYETSVGKVRAPGSACTIRPLRRLELC